jgi:outer membrane receptor protein involved in Fe transport
MAGVCRAWRKPGPLAIRKSPDRHPACRLSMAGARGRSPVSPHERLLVKKTLSLLALTTALVPLYARADSPAPDTATPPPAKAAFTTGVAKGRDLLDTAISASTISNGDLQKIGTTSIAEAVGNIPGIRAETGGTDGRVSITIRGLPLDADGSKFLQIEEDGLPVMEFGDLYFGSVTQFLRTDLSLAQIQAIRGGSASTFASNSPGGVVNFLSKTGEENGGMLQVSSGMNYDLGRIDFDYGGKIDDHWRFNLGGFYHQGEGPRASGYQAFQGGQIKFNITRTFDAGYIRVYAKVLDDREPYYGLVPVSITGSNSAPDVAAIPGFDPRKDSAWSRNIVGVPILGQTNQPQSVNFKQGDHSKVRSFGIEAQFDVAGWSISDHFRFSDISGQHNEAYGSKYIPAAYLAGVFGGPGATLSYADGPLVGQAVANPAGINGNGLAEASLHSHADLNSLNYTVNDLRASRVWTAGPGKLTTTAGLYVSSQDINALWSFVTTVGDIAGGGNSALFNITTATGVPVTQQGVLAYQVLGSGGAYHRLFDVNFRILAPYGSANYQLGKLAIGGSLRYDFGKVTGAVYGSDLRGGRVGSGSYDFDGNGVITPAESQVAVLPLTQPASVGYSYGYLSYSIGANYRFAEGLSAFARYSKGARASAERNLAVPTFNPATGQLASPDLAYSPIKQAEVGAKFRSGGVTLYVTGFWASTTDNNYQVGSDNDGATIVTAINRTYSAKGVEVEGEARKGPFSLRLGATYTKSKIDNDLANAAENGLTPRHEPNFFFTAMPQFETRLFSIGANVMGVTSSYAQDTDLLKQPGYVLVNPFVEVRPASRVTLSLNVFNLFNKLAIVELDSAAVPAGGVANALTMNGRTVKGSIRVTF